MALSGAALGTALKAALDAVSDKTDREEIFEAMGTAIVNYLKANAQVVVASVSGVTTGGGVSGPGTGTIT
jgi:enoyl-CoA hydratase/carnithine racemase